MGEPLHGPEATVESARFQRVVKRDKAPQMPLIEDRMADLLSSLSRSAVPQTPLSGAKDSSGIPTLSMPPAGQTPAGKRDRPLQLFSTRQTSPAPLFGNDADNLSNIAPSHDGESTEHPMLEGDDDDECKGKNQRTDKQKVSNCLAQKRYRERKKRAFMDMRHVVESLSAEVESLRCVKTENERLAQTVAALQGLAQNQQDRLGVVQGGRVVKRKVKEEACAAGVVGNQSALLDGEGSFPRPMPVVNDHWGLHQAGGMSTPLARRNATVGEPGLMTTMKIPLIPNPATQPPPASVIPVVVASPSSQQSSSRTNNAAPEKSVRELEREWETHMIAMEQVLAANQMQGLPNGPISEEALQLLSQMISNLYNLNAKMLNARMKDVLEVHRQNTERIGRVFHGLSGVKNL